MLPPLWARWHDSAASEERRVSEREIDEQRREETIVCTVCGTVNVAGDQYCAECGAPIGRGAAVLSTARWRRFGTGRSR